MAYRIRAGFSKVARAIVVFSECIIGKPISETSKKKLAMSATRRDNFTWTVTRDCKDRGTDVKDLFVRVIDDVPETVPAEEKVEENFPEEPVVEKVYRTPAYSVSQTPTSSGAMMFEFSGSRFDYDAFSEMGDECDSEVYSAPVTWDYSETEEEKQFYEGLYEDLTVEAVLDYMDTIELYAHEKEETEAPVEEEQTVEILGLLSAPVSNISGLLSAPYSPIVGYLSAPVTEYVETEEEKQFYEGLYEDLTVEAVLDYMDTIEIYAPVKEHVETEEEKQYFEDLYEDLEVEAILGYMDTIELEAKYIPDYVISEIESPEICETSISIEPKFVPDYVISEISSSEVCETVVEIEAEQPAAEPVQKSILAQFVFGFDAPVTASPGSTKFRFIAGTEEEPEEDIEDVQVMTYSGNAAVSAQSFSNGPLAL